MGNGRACRDTNKRDNARGVRCIVLPTAITSLPVPSSFGPNSEPRHAVVWHPPALVVSNYLCSATSGSYCGSAHLALHGRGYRVDPQRASGAASSGIDWACIRHSGVFHIEARTYGS